MCDTYRMRDATQVQLIQQKYEALLPVMDERLRRQWAAAEASTLGWGGTTTVAAATGLARNTITTGVRELAARAADPQSAPADRIRRPGAGRKPLTDTDPGLAKALDRLVDPVTR